MNQFDNEVVKINVVKIKELQKEKEHKIELEWLFEFSEETSLEHCLPEGKLYTTHAIGTVKWNSSLNHWQLVDIAIIDCHAASLDKIYALGEVIDLEEDNIKVTMSPLRVVKHVEKEVQAYLNEYKDKPKAKNLNGLGISCLDDEFAQMETMYF